MAPPTSPVDFESPTGTFVDTTRLVSCKAARLRRTASLVLCCGSLVVAVARRARRLIRAGQDELADHAALRVLQLRSAGPQVQAEELAVGQVYEESDVDLLAVLDEIENRVREWDGLVDVLDDLEVDSRRAIQASPVAEAAALSTE
jgi:hypothetical protein